MQYVSHKTEIYTPAFHVEVQLHGENGIDGDNYAGIIYHCISVPCNSQK